jgi:hypothetical protein
MVRRTVAETDMKVKIRFLEEDLGRAATILTKHQELNAKKMDVVSSHLGALLRSLRINDDSESDTSGLHSMQ